MLKIHGTHPQLLIAACISMLLLFSQGTLAAENERILFQAGPDFVKIVPQDKDSAPNDHPFAISKEEIASILAPLTYKKKSLFGSSDNEPVFEQRQLDKLSGYLSEGFKSAGYRQDIVFALTGNKGALLGSKALVTTGRAFINAGQLNVIFGHVDLDYETYLDRKDPYAAIERGKAGKGSVRYKELTAELIEAHPLEPGSRDSERSMEKVKVSSRGDQAVQSKRDDWVRITLRPRSDKDLAEMERIRHSSEEIERMRDRREGRYRDEPRRQEYRSAPARRSYKDTMTIDERLAKLKELYEKELIDEATYQRRLEEIVGEL